MDSSGKERYVLGLDLGTSSLKAVLLRADGVIMASATRSYPIAVPQPGWAEQQPDQWWEACCDAIRTLLSDASVRPDQVVALCPGGQMHGTVLLDCQGRPTRPAIIWPDQRSGPLVQGVEAVLESAGLIPVLGGGVAAGFMLLSLLWCRDHEPATWARTTVALLPKDYLRYRLTGVLASEPSDGTGIPAVDLFTPVADDLREVGQQWCIPALELLNLPTSLLPPLRASVSQAGTITAEAAAATGLNEGTPVLHGGSDQAMAAIGAGLLEPGTILVSLSTGGQIVTPLTQPLRDLQRGLRTVCHAVPGTYLALSATLGAGISWRWLREQLLEEYGLDADARLIEQAAQAPAGAGGLLFLPYLVGERAPLLDPAASGAFIGIRADHGRPQLIRAVLEGIAFSVRHALEPLQGAGVRFERVLLAGGLARSECMRGIMAAVLGQAVIPLETAEQSALGAALLAAHFSGFFPSLQAACDTGVAYGPSIPYDPELQKRYTRLYALYRGLYPQLRETMHALQAETNLPAF